MAYRVEIARRAESDLEELYLWVVERAPQRGARWFNGLERAVLSLHLRGLSNGTMDSLLPPNYQLVTVTGRVVLTKE